MIHRINDVFLFGYASSSSKSSGEKSLKAINKASPVQIALQAKKNSNLLTKLAIISRGIATAKNFNPEFDVSKVRIHSMQVKMNADCE